MDRASPSSLSQCLHLISKEQLRPLQRAHVGCGSSIAIKARHRWPLPGHTRCCDLFSIITLGGKRKDKAKGINSRNHKCTRDNSSQELYTQSPKYSSRIKVKFKKSKQKKILERALQHRVITKAVDERMTKSRLRGSEVPPHPPLTECGNSCKRVTTLR